MSNAPIDEYLDDLLRRTRGEPRTVRRLLDETSDHLHAAAAELEAGGLQRVAAEREAVRRFGPVDPLVRASRRRSFVRLVLETVRAAILLGSIGLIAVGVSGGLAALMNALFGREFVGGTSILGTGGPSVVETADDAVALRVLAGVVGLVVLAGWAGWSVVRRYRAPADTSADVLPPGLVDALGAAAFAAGAVGLTGASIGQAVHGNGGHGVGFFLSGALVCVAGAALFCTRATRALLPSR